MSCNSVATVSSQLKLDMSQIVKSQKIAEAAATMLAPIVNEGQAMQPNVYAGYGYTYMYAPTSGMQIYIYADGRLAVRGGAWMSQTAVAAMQAKIAETLTVLAGTLAQVKAQALIAKRFAVTETQRQSNGAVVMSFEL